MLPSFARMAAAVSASAALARGVAAVPIDGGVPLRCYYVHAQELFRQAKRCHARGMHARQFETLVRFVSLVVETVPRHEAYDASAEVDRKFRRLATTVLGDLEVLKKYVDAHPAQAAAEKREWEREQAEGNHERMPAAAGPSGTTAALAASASSAYESTGSLLDATPVELARAAATSGSHSTCAVAGAPGAAAVLPASDRHLVAGSMERLMNLNLDGAVAPPPPPAAAVAATAAMGMASSGVGGSKLAPVPTDDARPPRCADDVVHYPSVSTTPAVQPTVAPLRFEPGDDARQADRSTQMGRTTASHPSAPPGPPPGAPPPRPVHHLAGPPQYQAHHQPWPPPPHPVRFDAAPPRPPPPPPAPPPPQLCMTDVDGDIIAGTDPAGCGSVAHGSRVPQAPLQVSAKHRMRVNKGDLSSAVRDFTDADYLTLTDRLNLFGMRERVMEGDGNCQFRALADQMYHDQSRHADVRRFVIAQLQGQRELYEPYVPEAYEEYVERMSRPGTWGDHITLQAASDAFGLKICVLTSYEESYFLEIDPKALRYKRKLWLTFWAEIHYNSIASDSIESGLV